MKAQEYVTKAVMTESNNFISKSFLGSLTYKLFLKLHKGTLASRFVMFRNIRLLHATIGAMTEIGELFEMLEREKIDLTNLREEVGDITWYIAIACDELKLDMEPMVKKGSNGIAQNVLVFTTEQSVRVNTQEILATMTIKASKALDLMKKSAFYGKPLDEASLAKQLEGLVMDCEDLLQLGGFNIEESFDINIKKLQMKRFKAGKFTEGEANNRNLAEERKTLEGKD